MVFATELTVAPLSVSTPAVVLLLLNVLAVAFVVINGTQVIVPGRGVHIDPNGRLSGNVKHGYVGIGRGCGRARRHTTSPI